METRVSFEELERQTLAPYAAFSEASRGREHDIKPDPIRTPYQRDRDRIIHCAAFRKLEYKTQVYVIHEDDYYRTRLTHTMEVAQIARTLARVLGLNADLTEAVALAHDMGHTPFGHSGEAALHRVMRDHGGFEHNLQGVRVVEHLEERYSEHRGLNLSYEIREGIAKHSTSYDSPKQDFFEPHLAATLEAQLVDVADEIAFNQHDLDDALKMKILTRADLEKIPWVAELASAVEAKEGKNAIDFDTVCRCRLVGALIDLSVRDALEQTRRNIEKLSPTSLDDVRAAGTRLAAFSPEMAERNRQMRAFLFEEVYRHPWVVRMTTKAEGFIERLFELYRSNVRLLPRKYQARCETEEIERVIADYISGMTDRYCMQEYRRSFLP